MEDQNGENCAFLSLSTAILPSGLRYPSQNAELFTMAYGALVIQLIQDYEDYTEVNKQLEKM